MSKFFLRFLKFFHGYSFHVSDLQFGNHFDAICYRYLALFELWDHSWRWQFSCGGCRKLDKHHWVFFAPVFGRSNVVFFKGTYQAFVVDFWQVYLTDFLQFGHQIFVWLRIWQIYREDNLLSHCWFTFYDATIGESS